MKLSRRSQSIKPSITLALAAKAKAMRAEGVSVINFAAGEPSVDTPERIKRAAIQALDQGMTKYTEVRGIAPLREAIALKYRKEQDLEYDKDQVLVSCGGKHSLYNICQAILDEGDEVLIPAPYWVSYRDIVVLCGGVPRMVEPRASGKFHLTPEELRSALGTHTRALILNSPNNPTGAAYGREELLALSQVLESHDCLIISDDVYEKIVYDGFVFHNIAAVNPKLKERTVIVNSASKTYSMTGWRIGYSLGPAELIAAAGKIQSQNTSNPTSFAQAGFLEALQGPQDEVQQMVKDLQVQRDALLKRFDAMDGVECVRPEGAFYLFPSIRAFLGRNAKKGKIASACDLTEYLLEEAQVVAVPGEDFGSPDHIRFTYTVPPEEIEQGCDRMQAALAKLG